MSRLLIYVVLATMAVGFVLGWGRTKKSTPSVELTPAKETVTPEETVPAKETAIEVAALQSGVSEHTVDLTRTPMKGYDTTVLPARPLVVKPFASSILALDVSLRNPIRTGNIGDRNRNACTDSRPWLPYEELGTSIPNLQTEPLK